MLIKKRTGTEIPSSEITPKDIYLNRRSFMTGAAAVAGAAVLTACAPKTDLSGAGSVVRSTPTPVPGATAEPTLAVTGPTDELGDPLTSYENVTNYNNYYEFSTNKEAVAGKAKDFPTEPWVVTVSGMVNNPRSFDMDEIRNEFDQEERIYRLRCVEGWSMVIPWLGFPLARCWKSSNQPPGAIRTLRDGL